MTRHPDTKTTVGPVATRLTAAGFASARLALALLLAGSLLLGVAFPPRPALAAPGAANDFGVVPFSDIVGHWARPELEALWARGAIPVVPGQGGAPAVFRPDAPITRGDFVTMLVRVLGYGQEATELTGVRPPFTDVGSTSGSPDLAGFVSAGVEHDLVRGYPDGTFRPDKPITRAEMSALLVRVLELEPAAPGPGAFPFTDRAEVPAWAAGYIQVAYERGMVRGYPDGAFRPLGGATRAEAACLVCRAARTGGQLFDVTGIVRGASATGDTLAVDLWPAGAPEATLDATGTLVVTDAAKLEPSGPGPTVYLRVPPPAIVYRDGNPARRADVQPLDEVSLVLDASGTVVYVQALLWDGVATIVSLGPTGESITLRPAAAAADSPARTLPILRWAPVFRDGRETTVADLQAGVEVYFILDTATGAVRVLAVRAASGLSGKGAGPAGAVAQVDVSDPATAPAPLLSPAQAMALNAQSIGTAQLSAATGADGTGVVIAIIDTGVDVSHPDLTMTSALGRKVVDWADFSGEGDVSTTRLSSATKGIINTDLGPARTGGLVSRSGFFHSGILREADLDSGSPLGRDLDRNGSNSDSFLVVVADRKTAGVYDTAYVDTDRDLDFSEEAPLQPYRESGIGAWFGGHTRTQAERCSFVLADLRADGNRVTLGFDGNGHGTHVAATAAGHGSYRGGPNGVAPGAQILAIKALGSSGDGSWVDIIRAVAYATQRGANIIVLSVANLSGGDDLSEETAEIARLAENSGALIVLAAGNDGPGLGTARGPGAGAGLISVGAGINEAMWRSFYGYEVPGETVWPFSSVGPRADGAAGPDLVAPGVAISAAPYWLESPGYVQYEGTSMAVPHVAGAAALLWQAAREAGVPVSAGVVQDALLGSARYLSGYAPVEQGHGVIDSVEAWRRLQANAVGAVPSITAPRGYYSRGTNAARVLFDVTRRSAGQAGGGVAEAPLWLDIASDAAWLVPEKGRLALPVGVSRALGVAVNPGAEEGLYAGRLTGRSGRGEPLDLPVTVVVPAEFTAASHWGFTAQGTLAPARVARHYFRVPPGVDGLEFSVGVPAGTGGLTFAGRVKAYLYGPDGRLAANTGYVGEGAADVSGYTAGRVYEPAPGVWEAVVYSSAALSAFELDGSEYWFEAALQGLVYDLPGTAWEVTVPGRETTNAPLLPAVATSITRAWRAPEAPGAQVWGTGWPPSPNGAGSGAGSGAGQGRVPSKLSAGLAWTSVRQGFEGEVSGYGLWGRTTGDPWQTSRPEAAALAPGGTFTKALPRLEGAPGFLRVVLRAIDGPGSSKIDLDLYLYRRDVSGWREAGASATVGVSDERIELTGLAAGDYVVYVEAGTNGAGDASFTVQAEWLAAVGQVAPTGTARSFGSGEAGSLPVAVTVPSSEGLYRGAVRVGERSAGLNFTASLLPLRVRRGGGPLQLTLAPGTAFPGRNRLTFQARDQSGQAAGDFTLELNGRVYEASGGTITVLTDVPQGTLPLRVEARLTLADGTASAWVFLLPGVSGGAGGRQVTGAPDGVRRPDWLDREGFRSGGLAAARSGFAHSAWGGQ